jgi:hypothetical protein
MMVLVNLTIAAAGHERLHLDHCKSLAPDHAGIHRVLEVHMHLPEVVGHNADAPEAGIRNLGYPVEALESRHTVEVPHTAFEEHIAEVDNLEPELRKAAEEGIGRTDLTL